MKDGAFDTLLQKTAAESGISGIALAVAYGAGPVHTYVTGTDIKENQLTASSLFPVASITKLAVALGILRLLDQAKLSVDDLLVKYLPESAAAQPGVTLKRLLTHSAGLPEYPKDAWVWDEHLSWPVMAQASLKIAPILSPGVKVTYSSLNYGLLALVIERITGDTLSRAIPELVFRPLGIEAYLGVEPPRQPVFIQDPADTYAGTPLELWNTPFWRALGEPWGGLVTTPTGALMLLRAYLGHPKGFLHPETVVAATQDQTGGLGGGFDWQEFPYCPWGLGPWIYLEGMQHWSYPNAPGGTLGHTGYSGCLISALPEREIVWAIHGTVTCADPWWQKGFIDINAVDVDMPIK